MTLLIETLFLRVSDAGARCMDLEDPPASVERCERRGRVELIAAPTVRTLLGERAQVTQGARVPYLNSSADGTSVRFAESALTLDFDPRPAPGGVTVGVQAVERWPDFTTTELGNPGVRELRVDGEVQPGGWTRLLLEDERLGEIRWFFGLARREVVALWLFVRVGGDSSAPKTSG